MCSTNYQSYKNAWPSDKDTVCLLTVLFIMFCTVFSPTHCCFSELLSWMQYKLLRRSLLNWVIRIKQAINV